MGEPNEVTKAVMADALAQRYGVLPDVILESDAEVLRLFNIAAQMQAIRSQQ